MEDSVSKYKKEKSFSIFIKIPRNSMHLTNKGDFSNLKENSEFRFEHKMFATTVKHWKWGWWKNRKTKKQNIIQMPFLKDVLKFQVQSQTRFHS